MAGQIVTVGCKLPNGLIIEHMGKTHTLKGSNSTEIVGGHGLTVIDKELWDAWYDKHKDYQPVKQGLIFAHEKLDSAQSIAKERAKNKSGFEGLDPDKPGAGLSKMTDKD